MKEKTTPLEIRQALVHEGSLHVVTACGRLWRQDTRMGRVSWKEIPGPHRPEDLHLWLRRMGAVVDQGVEL